MTDGLVDRYSVRVGLERACAVFGVVERSYRHRVKVRHDKALHDAKHVACSESTDSPETALQSISRTVTPESTASCRWCKTEVGTKRERTWPTHPAAYTPVEREHILHMLCSERFVDMPAEQVYWSLLDEGTYLCSSRTMYRILADHHASQNRRRRRYTPKGSHGVPRLHADAPNRLWSWDVTLIPSGIKGIWHYLYVMVDVFSRKIVGWMAAGCESDDNAEKFISETCHRHHIDRGQLTIHADRGSIMKAKKVADLFILLGVTKSHSRPHVSNDNPYSESLFKTLKYRHDYPLAFTSIRALRRWINKFVHWYNYEHHHSGIAYFHPAQVHDDSWRQAHAQRQVALDNAFDQHSERFHRRPVATEPPSDVWINRATEEENSSTDDAQVVARHACAAGGDARLKS